MYQNTIGWKQNNLGNLRGENVKWQGKTGFQNGFSVFESKEYGVRAIYVDLLLKIKKGTNTIEKILHQYAPASENDTLNYISFVSKNTRIPKNQVLTGSEEETRSIVRAIIKHETGYSAPLNLLVKAENLLSVKKKQ